MNINIYFHTKRQKKLSYREKISLYLVEFEDFKVIHRRTPNKEEEKELRKKIFTTRQLRYIGICPMCNENSEFYNRPLKYTSKDIIKELKAFLIVATHPVSSIKQALSTHKLAWPSYCECCGENLLICPICNVYLGPYPIDPTEKSKCHLCKSSI